MAYTGKAKLEEDTQEQTTETTIQPPCVEIVRSDVFFNLLTFQAVDLTNSTRQNSQTTGALVAMPDDILSSIFSLLPLYYRVSLALTSKRLASAATAMKVLRISSKATNHAYVSESADKSLSDWCSRQASDWCCRDCKVYYAVLENWNKDLNDLAREHRVMYTNGLSRLIGTQFFEACVNDYGECFLTARHSAELEEEAREAYREGGQAWMDFRLNYEAMTGSDWSDMDD